MVTCSVMDCERPRRTRTADLCNAHYFRQWRTGAVGDPAISDRVRPACSVDGCEREHHSRGYCRMHERRVRKGGSPDYVPGPKRGADNAAWKHNAIGYTTAHQRVYKTRGPASAYVCPCGRQASHWAYRHDDPAELHTPAGLPGGLPAGLPYSVNPAHYDPRCVPCHKRADLAR